MPVSLYLNHRPRKPFYIEETVMAVSGNVYEIQERIDSGGNAVVHKCTEYISGDEYAIKFHLSTDFRRLRRFKQEIELVKRISHDQLIGYVDEGKVKAKTGKDKKEEKRLPFLIMPVADENLMDHVKKAQAQISYENYIGQFKGLTSALATLHDKAIHRDIKPENILIIGDTWLLSDLGLCKFSNQECEPISHENEPIGPRYWMSPEAINRIIGNNDEVSIKSDIFQLCSIFWFVVTGRHPTGVITKEDWTGPEKIFDPIFRSLSHNPIKRPSDANELLNLLNEAALELNAN